MSYNVAPNPDDTTFGIVPVGTIVMWSAATAPSGYLICDGSAVSRITQAHLFSVIGTTYGAGDGATTFNIPDIRGQVVRGLDSTNTDYNTLGETAGQDFRVIGYEMLPNHSHTITDPGHFHEFYQGGANAAPGATYRAGDPSVGGVNTAPAATGITIPASLIGPSGQTTQPPFPLDLRNPYITLNYIIKV